MKDVMIQLAALWAARSLSGRLGDSLRATDSVILKEIIAGETAIPITQELLLIFSVLLLVPIVMFVLSVTLKDKANRWANIGVGIFFVGFDLLFVISIVLAPIGSALYDTFLGFVYPVFTGLVVLRAWKWPRNAEVN